MIANCPFSDSERGEDGRAVSVYVCNEDKLDTSGTLFAELLQETDTDSVENPEHFKFDMSDLSDSDDENILDYLTTPKVQRFKSLLNGHTSINSVEDDDFINAFEGDVSNHVEETPVNTVTRPMRACKQVITSEVKPIVLDAKALLLAATSANTRSRKKPLTENHINYRRGECPSKSAMDAKKHREMKKRHVANLENKVECLSNENVELKNQVKEQFQQVESLQKEVVYLRNVISNQSCLSSILKCLPTVPGLQFISNNNSINMKSYNTTDADQVSGNAKGKRKLEDCINETGSEKVKPGNAGVYVRATGSPKKIKVDNGSTIGPLTPPITPVQEIEEQVTTGGVCLHVSDNKASLEFCAACAESAVENWKRAGDHSYFKKASVKKEQL